MVYSVYSFVHRQIDKPQRDYFDKGFCRWARTFSKNLKTQMNYLKQSRFLQKWCYNSLLKMRNTVQHQETISYITGGQHKILEILTEEWATCKVLLTPSSLAFLPQTLFDLYFQDYLFKIWKRHIPSERHEKFFKGQKERRELQETSFGPIDDDDQVIRLHPSLCYFLMQGR